MKAIFCWLALALSALGANPYLTHPDDAPVTRQFTGKEWGDEVAIPEGKESAPFRADVTTQRVASMPWGAIYKVTVETASQRQIEPRHYLATDNEILLLSSEDMDREIRVISAMIKQPKFEKRDLWGLSKGSLKLVDGPWTTEIRIKGDICRRQAQHDGSGHFGRIAWKKGIGLVEYAMGRGAMADGFELEWKPAKAK